MRWGEIVMPSSYLGKRQLTWATTIILAFHYHPLQLRALNNNKMRCTFQLSSQNTAEVGEVVRSFENMIFFMWRVGEKSFTKKQFLEPIINRCLYWQTHSNMNLIICFDKCNHPLAAKISTNKSKIIWLMKSHQHIQLPELGSSSLIGTHNFENRVKNSFDIWKLLLHIKKKQDFQIT